MTRKIPEIEQANTLQVQSRINDTYVRPAGQAGESSLERIAGTMLGLVSPVKKHLEQKKEIQDNFEIAQGMRLRRDLLSEGKDFSDEEIKERLKAGEYKDAYKGSVKNLYQGYAQAQHMKTGAELKAHMQTYLATATMKNAQGETVPISQIQDQDAVMTTVFGEMERYVKEQTGGRYDPVYYEQYIKPEADKIVDYAIEQQAKARLDFLSIERQKAGAAILNSTILPLIKSKEFDADPEAGVTTIRNSLEAEGARLISEGRTQTEATEFLTKYVQNCMEQLPFEQYDKIEQLRRATEGIDLLSAPAVQSMLLDTKNSVETSKYYEKKRKEEYDEDLNMQKASDLYYKAQETGNYTEFLAFVSPLKNKEYFLKAMQINKAYEEFRTEMPFEEYRHYQVLADQGKLDFVQVQMLASKMSEAQTGSLKSTVREGETRARTFARAENTTISKASKKLESIAKQVDKTLAEYFKVDTTLKSAGDNPDTKANVRNLQTRMGRKVYNEYVKWLSTPEGAASNSIEKEDALYTFTEAEYSKNKNMFDILIKTPSLIDNPKADYKRIRSEEDLGNFHKAFDDVIDPKFKTPELNEAFSRGDIRAVSKAISKSGKDKTKNPRQTAQRLISLYSKADKNKNK